MKQTLQEAVAEFEGVINTSSRAVVDEAGNNVWLKFFLDRESKLQFIQFTSEDELDQFNFKVMDCKTSDAVITLHLQKMMKDAVANA